MVNVGNYTIHGCYGNGISPFSIGNTSSKGPFSIAILVYWSVIRNQVFLLESGDET